MIWAARKLLLTCLRAVGVKNKSAIGGGPVVDFPEDCAAKAESLKHLSANLLSAPYDTMEKIGIDAKILRGARARRLALWRGYRQAEKDNDPRRARELRAKYEAFTQELYQREEA